MAKYYRSLISATISLAQTLDNDYLFTLEFIDLYYGLTRQSFSIFCNWSGLPRSMPNASQCLSMLIKIIALI